MSDNINELQTYNNNEYSGTISCTSKSLYYCTTNHIQNQLVRTMAYKLTIKTANGVILNEKLF